jgi:hypothetical protein
MISPPPAPFQRRGTQSLSNNNVTGPITIVSAAANINGIIVRTAFISAGANRYGNIQAGTQGTVVAVPTTTTGGYDRLTSPGFLLAAGMALTADGNSASPGDVQFSVTWDVI